MKKAQRQEARIAELALRVQRQEKCISGVMVLLGKWRLGEPGHLTAIRNMLSPVAPVDPLAVITGGGDWRDRLAAQSFAAAIREDDDAATE